MGEDAPQSKIGASLVRVQPEEASDLECFTAPPSVAARDARRVGTHGEEILPRLALPVGASATSRRERGHGTDLSTLLWIGCPHERGRGVPHRGSGAWTEAEAPSHLSDGHTGGA
jgi:hypothetical protein